MVIQTKEFPYFKHAYKGVYGDCYLVGIAEIFIYRTGATEPMWEKFEDRLPETLDEFRDFVAKLQAEGGKLITFIMVTAQGITKKDFEVADILDFKPQETGPLAGIPMPVGVIVENLNKITLFIGDQTAEQIHDQELALDSAVKVLQRLQESPVSKYVLPERVEQFIKNVARLRKEYDELALLPDNTANRASRFELKNQIAISLALIDTFLLNHKSE